MHEINRPIRKSSRPRLQEISPSFQSCFRAESLHRILQIGRLPTAELIDHPYPDDYMYGDDLTIIQLISSQLNMTFKVHYNFAQNRGLLSQSTRSKSEASSERYLTDLFKEYSNVVLGEMCKQLAHNSIYAEISLPLDTWGLEELISANKQLPSTYYDYFQISGEGFCFSATSTTKINVKHCLDEFLPTVDRPDNAKSIILL